MLPEIYHLSKVFCPVVINVIYLIKAAYNMSLNRIISDKQGFNTEIYHFNQSKLYK